MYKKVSKGDKSYDDISRELYGTTEKSGSLAKINNNTDGDIIVFTPDKKVKSTEGTQIIVEDVVYDNFVHSVLVEELGRVKGAMFYFEYNPDVHNFKNGQNVIVYDDGELFLRGVIKVIKPGINDSSNIMQLAIKSRAGLLIDTVVPPPLEFTDSTLKTVFEEICSYFGVDVAFSNDVELSSTYVNEVGTSYTARFDEYAWDFLVRIASANGLIIRDDGEKLLVGKMKESAPIKSFIEGETVGINSWGCNFNTDNLKRYYEAHTLFPTSGSAIAELPFDLPLTDRIKKPDGNLMNIKTYANWYACREVGKAFELFVSIDDSLKLICGDCVVVQSKSCYLKDEFVFMIKKKAIISSKQIRLALTLPCAYTGQLPERLPLC